MNYKQVPSSLCVLLTLLCQLSAISQDIVVLKDGTVIKAIVKEVGESEIAYKKYSNPNGPNYRVNTSKILSIAYQNGDIDKFPIDNDRSESRPTISTSSNQAADNKKIINKYSATDLRFSKKKPNSTPAKSAIIVYRVSTASILSTNDIEISLQAGWHNLDIWYPLKSSNDKNISTTAVQLQVSVKNKTDHPLFIDLSKSFRYGNLIGQRSYYDGASVTEQASNTNGIGIGIGNIGFGTSNSSTSAVTTHQASTLRINPHSEISLPKKQMLCSDKEIHGRYDFLSDILTNFTDDDRFNGLTEYSTLNFDENESPITIDFVITYSDNANLASPKETQFQLYAYQALGLPPIFGHWSANGRDRLKEIEGVESTTIIGTVNLEEVSPTSVKGNYYQKFVDSCILYGKW